jgi:hypothetical protein
MPLVKPRQPLPKGVVKSVKLYAGGTCALRGLNQDAWRWTKSSYFHGEYFQTTRRAAMMPMKRPRNLHERTGPSQQRVLPQRPSSSPIRLGGIQLSVEQAESLLMSKHGSARINPTVSPPNARHAGRQAKHAWGVREVFRIAITISGFVLIGGSLGNLGGTSGLIPGAVLGAVAGFTLSAPPLSAIRKRGRP